ncbi:MAG: hypothetical protein IJF37_01455 [Lachnospiraceae bacterium]|nr:hypothetical protein [Lachnospiraceae bacterium]
MTIGLSSFQLKMIAIISMVIDHVGMLMFPEEMAFRVIGRMSFPIYCFLIVEGFYHTSNVKNYIKRLAVFALISEIPFNILVSGNLLDVEHQNVFFTLLIGLLTVYAINNTINPMLKSLILVAGAMAAIALMTDYSFYGIILIYVFFNMREKRLFACIFMAVMSFIVSPIQGSATMAVIPIMLYNGEKGPGFMDKKVWKYTFYAFYPVHMMALYVIGCFISGL